MKTFAIKIFSAILIASSMYACVELDAPPYEGETDLTYWNNTYAAQEALNSCYGYLTNPQELFYKDAMSDNAYASKPEQTYPQAIGNGTHATDNGYVASVWNGRYAGIRLCNKLLDNIHLVPGLTDDLRKQYIGEAKVLRAISYYELLIRFGDIPYFTTTIGISESQTIARTAKSTVVNNILAELDEVLDNNMLPASYPASETGRITKWGAMGMKARIYLSQNMWPELEAVTQTIIEDSGHDLFPSYSGLFEIPNENNEEVMIDIQYLVNIRDYEYMRDILPPSMGGSCQLSPLQSLVDNYIMLNGKAKDEAGSGYSAADPYTNRDPRLKATVIYNGNSYDGGLPIKLTDGDDEAFGAAGTTSTGYYHRKYYDRNFVNGSVNSGLNVIYLRYGDVLLMHAEALAEQDELTSEKWDITIKALRTRAGFTDPVALNFPGTADLRDIVRRERRSELALEGLRYTDIIRWKTAETVLNGNALGAYTGEIGTIAENGFRIVEKRKFNPAKDYLWPVPQTQRDLNNNLGQNPNW